jgi:hypothetical protein
VIPVGNNAYKLFFLSGASNGDHAAGDLPSTHFHREHLRKVEGSNDVFEWIAYFNRLQRYAEIKTGRTQKLQVKRDMWRVDYIIAWRQEVRARMHKHLSMHVTRATQTKMYRCRA